ncbi:CapA family protein [Paenibacillus apis]|uniref:Capsular polysaccharide biosynthesis protein n=2 Tax=Paenibacillus apis TaxID=1792174 RepID=A0A919Y0K4_9BACL|nr:capsular polysaccharide biosynthesis protein [Paenibacillus apis]
MYPPRSEKNKKKQASKKRRQRRIWVWINLGLIFMIIVLASYLFTMDRPAENGATQPDHSVQEQGESVPPELVAELDGETGEKGASEGKESENDLSGESHQEVDASEENPDLASGTSEQERVVISFGGDTLFSGKVENKLKQAGYDYPYKHVKDLFLQDDLTVLNLETPVTEGGTPEEEKTFVFKSSPKAIPEMVRAGVEAVNLANNHILDQGVEGLLDTLEHLSEAGVLHVGAGKNSKEAFAPVYVERNGIRIALCGFSRVIPRKEWAAGKGPGVAATYDSTQAVKTIEEARDQADLVLVVVHWGKERTVELEKHQTELAHAYIDAGADLVIGGHPHVLQGLESYKGKWIAYSTGNFIFTKSKDPNTWETAVFQASCSKAGDCELKLVPYRTEVGQPVPMNEAERTQLWSELEAISPGVRIKESGEVHTGGG